MSNMKLFQQQQVRAHWDAEAEEWYFSLVDVVAALTDTVNPTDYLKKSANVMKNCIATWGQIVPR